MIYNLTKLSSYKIILQIKKKIKINDKQENKF